MANISARPLLSIVVPVYNEQVGLHAFYDSLLPVAQSATTDDYEIIFCDDGSQDASVQVITDLRRKNKRVKLVCLSRNFGKEIATSAGIHAATGEAVLTIDADGQHPVDRIPDFIERWRSGAKVVVGIRITNQNEGLIKRYGSKLFYGIFSRITGLSLKPGVTDFCLIDATVQADLNKLTERNRITRGLVDWLGYQKEYINFVAKAREHGEASYSVRKLFQLAINSMISLSSSPLHITAYIGAVVMPLSTLIGLVMAGNWLIGDPIGLNATGSAYLMVFILFLIGLLLLSQGIIGLYLSHIHAESQNRPLYIVDAQRSFK